MDLALNDLQRLICHKTQPTNHIGWIILFIYLFIYLFLLGVSVEEFLLCVQKTGDHSTLE